MMTLFEDWRLALRQICRAIGLSGTAATVVPLVVLGVALNIAALNAMEYMRNERHPCKAHDRTELRSAARTELKVMRTVLVSTLKKIGGGQRRWCVTQQWVMDRGTKVTGYNLEVGFTWVAPKTSDGCDVEFLDTSHRKMAVALVQC
jgi:hypothetical protein